ncbi:unnamed protein product [Cuscuta campestris]|uniref:Ty3 transposon capsid-like protein domain-containing protein n=1 Tax=Cuscuta campestris TaxID=132261 RepID=A0A484KW66_9ASTE|nr:unnamed protein product [Cuscuta campestris]
MSLSEPNPTSLTLEDIMHAINTLGQDLNATKLRVAELASSRTPHMDQNQRHGVPYHLGWRPSPSRTTPPTLDPAPRMRVDAPRFSADNPMGGIFRAQKYFDYFLTFELEHMQLVAMLIDHPTSEWFHYYQANNTLATWPGFLDAMQQRFDPNYYENYVGLLSKLTHTSSIMEYQSTFESILNKISGVPEMTLVTMYIVGLKQLVQREVNLWNPSTLPATFALARELSACHQEAAVSYSFGVRRPWPQRPPSPATTRILPTPTAATKPISPAPRTSTPATNLPIVRLTNAEKAERNKKGLYENPLDVEDFVDRDQEAPVISGDISSLHSLAGSPSPRSLKLEGSVKEMVVQVLLDGGSMHNLIHPAVAECLTLTLHPVTPFRVYVGNGDSLRCAYSCPEMPLCLQGHRFDVDLYILEIHGPDIVLGMQWLQTLGKDLASSPAFLDDIPAPIHAVLLSKYSHGGALAAGFDAPRVARLFTDVMVKHHGFPRSIISDRDSVFMSLSWLSITALYRRHARPGNTLSSSLPNCFFKGHTVINPCRGAAQPHGPGRWPPTRAMARPLVGWDADDATWEPVDDLLDIYADLRLEEKAEANPGGVGSGHAEDSGHADVDHEGAPRRTPHVAVEPLVSIDVVELSLVYLTGDQSPDQRSIMAFERAVVLSKPYALPPNDPLRYSRIPSMSPLFQPLSLKRSLSSSSKSGRLVSCGRISYSDDYTSSKISSSPVFERGQIEASQLPPPAEIQWKKELCNSVQLIGIVASPVQIRHLASGKAVAWSRLAVKKSENDTSWIDLNFWNELAHVAFQHVEKGRQIYVCGRLVSDTVEGDDGKQKTYYKVVVNELNFVERKTSSTVPYDGESNSITPGTKTKNYAANSTESVEELWQAFFANPMEWWDNRKNKRSPKYPDFKHKSTGESLWVEGWNNPAWVKSQLAVLDSRMEALQDHSMGVNFMANDDNHPPL